MTGHRWPWEPLGAIVAGSLSTQAARLGVHPRQVPRWRTEGLSDAMADRCAIAVGLHPSIIWPGWDGEGDDGEAELGIVA